MFVSDTILSVKASYMVMPNYSEGTKVPLYLEPGRRESIFRTEYQGLALLALGPCFEAH